MKHIRIDIFEQGRFLGTLRIKDKSYGKIGGMTYYRREDVMAAIKSKKQNI